MNEMIGELLPPARIMLTPGPSNMDPRVYRALSIPLVGHMDPWFIEMMGDVQALLRRVFQTQNRITFPISASGSGGIEAAVLNPLEEGDECIVCINGWFSERMAVIAERSPKVKVIRVEAPYGSTVDPEDVRRAGKGKKIKFVGLAHGETSSGVVQRLADFRKVADELGALLVVDAVATLAGVPLDMDRERIDICFSGSQKGAQRAAGNVADHRECARGRTDARAQDSRGQLVFRFHADHDDVGWRTHLSSHAADLLDLRACAKRCGWCWKRDWKRAGNAIATINRRWWRDWKRWDWNCSWRIRPIAWSP